MEPDLLSPFQLLLGVGQFLFQEIGDVDPGVAVVIGLDNRPTDPGQVFPGNLLFVEAAPRGAEPSEVDQLLPLVFREAGEFVGRRQFRLLAGGVVAELRLPFQHEFLGKHVTLLHEFWFEYRVR